MLLNLIAAVVTFVGGMVVGRCINGLKTEWFARIGVVVIACVTIPFQPYALSILFTVGFLVQSGIRINYVRSQKKKLMDLANLINIKQV